MAEKAEREDLDKLVVRLRELRTRTDINLRRCGLLRETIQLPDGRVLDFKLRPYQVQMILNLTLMPRFLVGDDTGLGKCAKFGTVVASNIGFIQIQDLGPKGALVPDTFYELPRPVDVWDGTKWVGVRRYYYGGRKPIRKIRTRRGYEVGCTLVHPLWTRSADGTEQWKISQELVAGNILCLCRNIPASVAAVGAVDIPFEPATGGNHKELRYPAQLTPDLSRLLGYVVAEGNRSTGISLTQYPGEAHDDMRRLLWELFGWRGNEKSKDRGIRILASIRNLALYMKACGIEEVLSADKVVPHVVMRSDRSCIREFLRGYFEGEGSVCGGTIEVSSASEKLLEQVHLLLLAFGIVGSRNKKWDKKYERYYWRIGIMGDDARRFSREIGFVSEKKKALLRELASKASNSNLDVVPHAKELVEGLRAAIQERSAGISKRWGSSFINTLQHIRMGRRNPTYAFLRKMLAVASEVEVSAADPRRLSVQQIVDQNWYYDPIVSIEEGEAEVADLEVDDPSHCFVGGGFVNHNTLETLAALGFKWEANPDLKVLIVTTKSAVTQWADEIHRFMQGVRTIRATGTPAQRAAAREAFLAARGPTALLYGYRSLMQDFSAVQDWSGMALIFDEATAFKNPQTRIHKIAEHLAKTAPVVWALTATLIRNNLTEGYGVFRVVVPELFPRALSAFVAGFCQTVSVPIKRGRRVDKIVGHAPAQIERFRAGIEPFYLGRAKADVAPDLPVLTVQNRPVPLSLYEWQSYKNLVLGMLLMAGEAAAGEDQKKISKMEALLRCQQMVNHAGLIFGEEAKSTESSKLEALIDMLTEGDLAEHRVIVYSRFRGFLVDYVEPRLQAEGVTVVRVTGSETEEQRRAAQLAFRSGKARVILLTSAG